MKQTSPAPRSVTMEDVARDAGVSRALVSLVMRDSPKVSPAKRTAVLEAAAALGYSPNRLASRLASHRTNTIGVLFLDLHNPVFADIYDGITEGLAGSGNQVMVAVGSADPGTELEAVRSFVDLRVDGVLLAGYTGTSAELAGALRGTPAVVITRELEVDGVDSVLTDDFRSGALAVEHLYGLGHRRIAHVDISDWLPYTARREGYLHAMEQFGLEPQLVHSDMTERGGRAVMEQFLDSGATLPTAVFAHNDLTAIGIMEALASRGLSVPGDVAIVGCDNIEVAASLLIGLTSIDQHAGQLGRLAAQAMLERVAGTAGQAGTRKLEPALMVRRSSDPAA
ncbi:LacI family DNA-binding transcriptional regulator [Pseudarthrobacter niigatensis]|uniref:DNA-binding LacI/PurR family transcriptional regulator n=1 Tax=Pseudarthrobacter niigatensis TaxID=369935 RepID=A0AAJ1SW78_9MICC|nr:LacI family DNA-binding transcriptional regulator [Pseudarthrobacter niigatensis]MDQ0146933.1 DNA-binding LacI/PurR family transcriptional regulator [Pseudarthrobacter niigatensis]MDQ0267065.1 DNA-binding LacI/PurR family transcriptional regulator [Pseudarthrobacter niigatensis]